MAIELKNIFFEYPGGFSANENLNLTIEDGERVAIIGQNGAGKTTAVKLMNGLHRPTAGDVIVDGINTKDRTTAQIAMIVGYVFQNPDDQIFNQSVVREIEYMSKYYKLDEVEIKKNSDEAIKLCGIEKYLETNPFDIPYPIRKFVTIASVIAAKPKYMILDEPTAGQDKWGINTLENIMNILGDRGISVVAISHDMEFVAKNFNRIVVMAHKNIIADGTAKEIFWNKNIVEEAKISQTQVGKIATELNLSGKILFCNELVSTVK